MLSTKKRFDMASYIVIVFTFLLFAAALFAKGMTHDLFLEAGVLLVSIKVILMQSKISDAMDDMEERLDKMHVLLESRRHQ